MRVLWISSFARKIGDAYNPPIAGPGAVSGSLFQQSLITGLEECGDVVDFVIDYPYQLGRYHGKDIFVRENGAIDYRIQHINLGVLSHLIKPILIRRGVSHLMKTHEYDCVIAYLIHSPYLKGLQYAKKKSKAASILICPDLPDMMDMSLGRKRIKSLLKRIDYKKIRNLYKDIDGYILFSDLMSERIPTAGKQHMTLEGIASIEDLDLSSPNKEKAIMYAGTLHRNIGIENIIQAMELLPKEVELWIFGDGDLSREIKIIAQNNPRVKFYGFLDRKKLFEYEKKASVLVNARNPDDEYTRYSFPSKTFEYLYSGTPFLTTKLPGVPEEYNRFMYLLPDNSPQAIACEVEKILATDSREILIRAKEIRRFVETKTSIYQANKVNGFLASVVINKGKTDVKD